MKTLVRKHLMPLCIILSWMISGIAFWSCTSDDDIPRIDNNKESTSNPWKRSETDAIDIAISNIDLLGHDAPKSRVTADIVANVSVIGNKLKSRSGAIADSLIYVVNFKDNEGFALIPVSKKADPLLAMCESGNYTADAEPDNPGFSLYMDMALDVLADIETASSDSLGIGPVIPWDPDPNKQPWEMKETDETIWQTNIEPRVIVEWSQNDIYGALAPNHTAGCGPVAIAQTMTYFNHPSYMRFTFPERSLSQITINWDEIKQHQHMALRPQTNPCPCSEQNHTNISHIIRQIGQDAHSSYDSATGSTNTTGSDIKQYLQSQGFSVNGFNDYKKGDSKKIGNGIILIGGQRLEEDKKVGHIWVLDGLREYTVKHTCYVRRNANDAWQIMSQQSYNYRLNHFNWGWGFRALNSYNGWFNDGIFDAYNPADHSVSNPSNANKNFCYDVKYIIVNH